MIIPDSRWEMPELLMSGKKPTGPVKIDWTNPLAPDRYCYLLGSKKVPVNYSKAEDSPRVYTAIAGTLTQAIAGGNQSDFISADWGTGIDVAGYELPPIGSMPSGFVFSRCWPTNATDAANGFIFGHGAWPEGARLYFTIKSGQLSYRLGTSGYGTSTFSGIANNAMVDLGITWANGTVRCYIDGAFDSSTSYSGTPGSSDDDTSIGFYMDGNSSVPALAYAGFIDNVFVGSRKLSDADMKSLSANPYQFLRPA